MKCHLLLLAAVTSAVPFKEDKHWEEIVDGTETLTCVSKPPVFTSVVLAHSFCACTTPGAYIGYNDMCEETTMTFYEPQPYACACNPVTMAVTCLTPTIFKDVAFTDNMPSTCTYLWDPECDVSEYEDIAYSTSFSTFHYHKTSMVIPHPCPIITTATITSPHISRRISSATSRSASAIISSRSQSSSNGLSPPSISSTGSFISLSGGPDVPTEPSIAPISSTASSTVSEIASLSVPSLIITSSSIASSSVAESSSIASSSIASSSVAESSSATSSSIASSNVAISSSATSSSITSSSVAISSTTTTSSSAITSSSQVVSSSSSVYVIPSSTAPGSCGTATPVACEASGLDVKEYWTPYMYDFTSADMRGLYREKVIPNGPTNTGISIFNEPYVTRPAGTPSFMFGVQLGYYANATLEFTGYFMPPTDGKYLVSSTADDGVAIFMGTPDAFACGNVTALSGGDPVSQSLVFTNPYSSGDIYLQAGVAYPIRIVWYNRDGRYGLILRWTMPGLLRSRPLPVNKDELAYGLVSRGEERLKDRKAQVALFDEVKAIADPNVRQRKLRVLREAVVSNGVVDQLLKDVLVYTVDTSFPHGDSDSYVPAMTRLLYEVHPVVPLNKSELQQMVSRYLIHLVHCTGQLDDAMSLMSIFYNHATEDAVLFLDAWVERDYVRWRELKLKYVDSDWAVTISKGDKKMQKWAHLAISASYFVLPRSCLVQRLGTESNWPTSWVTDGDTVVIRQRKSK
ncbi:hypothetical protein CANCADRAFT_3481 [Tortispora caseinolytica NRRL Y-17796]|uniref:PA14 domain-containing protein n=1 Tax=Tortispora caseinolytica NRRL Y-17796 TaxID=767744 RepID=A0A1E4TAS3_9ASCO|nr:hypothetical protein CANCADRAFT_3481 [Tortispora caseinolytica NRRL Y-17796]